MTVSRRKFLKIVLLPVCGALLSISIFKKWNLWIFRPVQKKFYDLTIPDFEQTDTGSLKPEVKQSLLTLTETLVGTLRDRGHYEMYFEWRAENLPGYKKLYEKFKDSLDQHARHSFACDFSNCNEKDRKNILKKFFPSGKFYALRKALVGKSLYILFYNHIIEEILKLFSRTDAWLLLGYRFWPGEARGLELYKKAP